MGPYLKTPLEIGKVDNELYFLKVFSTKVGDPHANIADLSFFSAITLGIS